MLLKQKTQAKTERDHLITLVNTWTNVLNTYLIFLALVLKFCCSILLYVECSVKVCWFPWTLHSLILVCSVLKNKTRFFWQIKIVLCAFYVCYCWSCIHSNRWFCGMKLDIDTHIHKHLHTLTSTHTHITTRTHTYTQPLASSLDTCKFQLVVHLYPCSDRLGLLCSIPHFSCIVVLTETPQS